MKAPAFACLVAVATMPAVPPAAAQSTTAPQAAPSMPPGETPPEAARDLRENHEAETSGRSLPEKPAPGHDPPRGETR